MKQADLTGSSVHAGRGFIFLLQATTESGKMVVHDVQNCTGDMN